MKKKSFNLYPYFIAIIVAIGGFLLGFDGAVVSGVIPFYKNTFEIDNNGLIEFSVGCILLGSILGSFFAGAISDRIGRKRALLFTAILFFLSALIAGLAPNVVSFIIGRLLGGIAMGVAILIAPVFIAEMAPAKDRGKLVSFVQLGIVVGFTVAYFSNNYILQIIEDPDVKWRWMLSVEAFPAALYFLLLLLIPESPRWLIIQGKNQEGKNILKKIGGVKHSKFTYAQITKSLSENSNITETGFRALFSKKMSSIMIIGLGLAFFHQVSGINVILYYAPTILEAIGSAQEITLFPSTIILTAFIGMTIVSMFFIDRIGRKPLILIGVTIMLISHLVLGLAFKNASFKIDDTIAQEMILKIDNEERKAYSDLFNKIRGRQFNDELEFVHTIKRYLPEENAQKFSTYQSILVNRSITISEKQVLFGILAFIIGFSLSLGPIIWVIFGEIFPNKLRGIAISVVGTVNAATGYLVFWLFPIN